MLHVIDTAWTQPCAAWVMSSSAVPTYYWHCCESGSSALDHLSSLLNSLGITCLASVAVVWTWYTGYFGHSHWSSRWDDHGAQRSVFSTLASSYHMHSLDSTVSLCVDYYVLRATRLVSCWWPVAHLCEDSKDMWDGCVGCLCHTMHMHYTHSLLFNYSDTVMMLILTRI